MLTTITIQFDLDKENIFDVLYQEGNEPAHPWTECTPKECVVIYGISQVLAKATTFTAAAERSGFLKSLEEFKDFLNY